MNVLEIEIDKLIPYINNPRKNDDAVDAVASSIHEFGWRQPIVVDKDYVIIVGHTRYKAAKKLGLETVPVVIADDLSESKVKALRIADNKVGEKAGWDRDLLKIELEEIKESDLDMLLTGFSTEELEGLLSGISEDDIDSFFTEPDTPLEDETEDDEHSGMIKCPHCGEWIKP